MIALLAVGKSNKLVAYELGIGSSTVSSHVRAACLKLGVRTRADLLHLIAAVGSRTTP